MKKIRESPLPLKNQSQQRNSHEKIINKLPLQLKKLKKKQKFKISRQRQSFEISIFIIFDRAIDRDAPNRSPMPCCPFPDFPSILCFPSPKCPSGL